MRRRLIVFLSLHRVARPQKRKPAKKKKKKAPAAAAVAPEEDGAAAGDSDGEDPAEKAKATNEASVAVNSAIAEIIASGRTPPRGFG